MKHLPNLVIVFALAVPVAFAQQATPGAANQNSSAQQPGMQQQGTSSTAQPGATGQTGNGTSGTMPQTGASAAPSAQNNVSGCLQRGFASYRVSDPATGKVYELRGNGANLSNSENHVVQIQGLPDPSASQGNATILYVEKLQDTGQVCGASGQQAAGNQPVTGETGNKGTQQNVTTTATSGVTPGAETPAGMGQSVGVQAGQAATPGATSSTSSASSNSGTAQAGSQASQPGAPPSMQSPGQSPAEASNNAAAASQTEVGAPSGTLGVGNNQPANTQQGGTSGAATGSTTAQPSGGMENKGTPQAGTPSTPDTSSAGSSAAGSSTGSQSGSMSGMQTDTSQQSGSQTSTSQGTSSQSSSASSQPVTQIMIGCVGEDATSFVSLGKTYTLTGKTDKLSSMKNHRAEVTAEQEGNTLNVQSARDLGTSCSAK
ncbi:MAG TPA: hypothetical protein VN577_02305 [Terriglobales bacterium]|nr:hypothetical protein [Terriglobales bacterium]